MRGIMSFLWGLIYQLYTLHIFGSSTFNIILRYFISQLLTMLNLSFRSDCHWTEEINNIFLAF